MKLLPKYAFCVIPERRAALGYPESTDYPLSESPETHTGPMIGCD